MYIYFLVDTMSILSFIEMYLRTIIVIKSVNTSFLFLFFFYASSANISNTDLQRLASEDYNACQYIYQEELKLLERFVSYSINNASMHPYHCTKEKTWQPPVSLSQTFALILLITLTGGC